MPISRGILKTGNSLGTKRYRAWAVQASLIWVIKEPSTTSSTATTTTTTNEAVSIDGKETLPSFRLKSMGWGGRGTRRARESSQDKLRKIKKNLEQKILKSLTLSGNQKECALEEFHITLARSIRSKCFLVVGKLHFNSNKWACLR